jgi:hypothetical protein
MRIRIVAVMTACTSMLGLGLAGVTTSAHASNGPAATSVTSRSVVRVLESCGGSEGSICSTIRPRKLRLIWGGPNAWISGMHWSYWGRTSARGTGVAWGADEGVSRLGRVTIVLHDPRSVGNFPPPGVLKDSRYFDKAHLIGGHGIAHYWHWSWSGACWF